MNINIIKTRDLFQDYLTNKNLKVRTIENYIYYFDKFHHDRFNQESVTSFLSLSQHRNTVSRGFLLNFKKFLVLNNRALGLSPLIKSDIQDVELPTLTGRAKRRIIKPIPHEKIFVLEDCLESESLKLQLLLSYFCGLRLGELLKITITSFNWEQWKQDPSKMGECRVFGKGDKEGIAIVPHHLMSRIATFIHDQGFESLNSHLFIDPKKEGQKLKNLARTWQLKLSRAGIKAGITTIDPLTNKPLKETVVHPHRLRHSYASYLLSKNVHIRKIQHLLRHSDLSSTQIYTHLDQDDLKDEISELFG